MAGFIDRYIQNPILQTISNNIKKLSSLGVKYEDMVVRNSRAIGITEAMFASEGPLPEDLLYTLGYADIGNKKYIPYFDKDLQSKRDFLRKFSMNGEIEFILDTIADESIVYDTKKYFCRPEIGGLGVHLKEDKRVEINEYVNTAFYKIYNAFRFDDEISAWQLFRQFLIDGFLSFEIIYDDDGKNIIGFKELDYVSLRPGLELNDDGKYISVWTQYPDDSKIQRKLYDSQLIFISYAKGSFISRTSYAERLIRSFNLLRVMENTRLIWNIMNATFRLKMIVPIGSKSRQKAQESLNELVSRYKEDVNIDFDSGELLINGRPSMQFYKNYMFPSKGGEHADIETVAGDGPDLSDDAIVQYFYTKLKVDSKIPFTRFDREGNGGQISIGAEGLDREEIRFYKFINRLRSIFQEIMIKPLWLQLCSNYPEIADDELIKSNISIKYNKDNIFEELKEFEATQKKLEFINTLKDYTESDGSTPFFDPEFLVNRYLGFRPEDLEENQRYIKKNKESKKKDDDDGGGGLDLNF